MYTTFLLAISSARRFVYITTPGLALDEALRDALMAAVGRGARVVLLIPGATDEAPYQVRRGDVRALLRAGAEIHEYRAALLHARTMVVDGVWSAVGSASLDRPSFGRHHELTLVVYGADVARELAQLFAEDLQHASPVVRP